MKMLKICQLMNFDRLFHTIGCYEKDPEKRSKKARRFEKMIHFDSSHSFQTRGSRVSPAPPHHTFSAFLNLNGIFIKSGVPKKSVTNYYLL